MKTENQNYANEYSEESFWKKVKKVSKIAGKEIIKRVLILYYCAQDKDTPLHHKTIIYSALGYFILPIDFIPDMTPLVGFADDMGALLLAYNSISSNLKQEHFDKADEQISKWFD